MISDTSNQDYVLPPPKMKLKKNIWIYFIIVGILALTVLLPTFQDWKNTELSVAHEKIRLATVKRSDLIRDVLVQGKVIASIKPILYSPAPGRVSLKVQPGDSVNKGDTIAHIHNPELINQYQQENSKLEGMHSEVLHKEIQIRTKELTLKQKLDLAKVTYLASRRELQRNKKGYEKGFQPLQKYDKAKDDLQRAELEFQHLREEKNLYNETSTLELQISRQALNSQQLLVDESLRKVNALSIKSPVTGVIGNTVVSEMDIVSRYQAILSVVDLGEYEVDVEVPESHASDLALGLDALIQLGPKSYNGSLTSISPEVKNSKVVCKVRFSDAMPASLRQNQRAMVTIMLETKNQVLTVNRGSFLGTSGGKFAYLVNDNIVTKTPIKTGSTSTTKVEILSGLNEGDTIVVSGSVFFDDKDQILLIN